MERSLVQIIVKKYRIKFGTNEITKNMNKIYAEVTNEISTNKIKIN